MDEVEEEEAPLYGHDSPKYQAYIKSPTWREKQILSRKRWGRKCLACGTGKTIDIHHKTYEGFGGEEKIDNLVPLCRTCHDEVHRRHKSGHYPPGRTGWKHLTRITEEYIVERGGKNTIALKEGKIRPSTKKKKIKTSLKIKKPKQPIPVFERQLLLMAINNSNYENEIKALFTKIANDYLSEKGYSEYSEIKDRKTQATLSGMWQWGSDSRGPSLTKRAIHNLQNNFSLETALPKKEKQATSTSKKTITVKQKRLIRADKKVVWQKPIPSPLINKTSIRKKHEFEGLLVQYICSLRLSTIATKVALEIAEKYDKTTNKSEYVFDQNHEFYTRLRSTELYKIWVPIETGVFSLRANVKREVIILYMNQR